MGWWCCVWWYMSYMRCCVVVGDGVRYCVVGCIGGECSGAHYNIMQISYKVMICMGGKSYLLRNKSRTHGRSESRGFHVIGLAWGSTGGQRGIAEEQINKYDNTIVQPRHGVWPFEWLFLLPLTKGDIIILLLLENSTKRLRKSIDFITGEFWYKNTWIHYIWVKVNWTVLLNILSLEDKY